MSTTTKPQAQYLKDYQAPQFSIQHINLRFELAPLKTSVQSTMTINRTDESNADLALDGVDLTLISVKVDDQAYDDYTLEDEKLIIHNLPASFILKIENHIDPQTNTSLEGLYFLSAIMVTSKLASTSGRSR
ncbi:MAG: hypothetical protein AAGK05_07555 [Pseudomonadota bacterium]